MFHKIKKVLPKEDLIVEVEFENKTKKIYDVKKVIPFDMFPNTAHVECVCVLKLK